MKPTNEATIWAACIQAAAAIHAVDLKKSRPADRPRLLMDEATHFYHAAMDYFPMAKSADWWMNQPSAKVLTKTGPSTP